MAFNGDTKASYVKYFNSTPDSLVIVVQSRGKYKKGFTDQIISIKTGDIRDHYNIKEEVGRGKFGVVYKVISKNNADIFAAKFIKVTKAKRKEVFHEIDIMKKLSHKNLVNLADVYDMDTRIVLIMEFISGGELFERIVEEDTLTESEAAVYMKQILEGLQHMHHKNIIHLDLKPENVVCVEPKSTCIKLIDFGLARQLEPGKETKITCGTPEFVAPEVLNFDPVTLASDMWSVGVIAYILLSGLSPFLGDTDSETFANVSTCEWDFDDDCFNEISDSAKEFIEGLIVSSPKERRSVDDCLLHKWIQSYNTKKSKRLRVDNLRKFLARKRWQKSVNAVRAIRRLSSFGAALLGKPSSLLRGKIQSETSEKSSISEEGPDTNTESCLCDSKVTANDPKEGENHLRSPDKKTDGSSEDAADSDEVFTRSTGRLSELRQKFQFVKQVFEENEKSNADQRRSNEHTTEIDNDVIKDQKVNDSGIGRDKDVLRSGTRDKRLKQETADSGEYNTEQKIRFENVDDDTPCESSQRAKDTFDRSNVCNQSEEIDQSPKITEASKHSSNYDYDYDYNVQAIDKTRDPNETSAVNNSAGEYSEDTTTDHGLRRYLERMIKDGRLPGNEIINDMPRPVSWSSSHAELKRASFRDALAVSASFDDDGSVDEDPIKLEVKKLNFEDFYEVQDEIGRGRFGVVNRVKEIATGQHYAAKYIKVRAATRDLVRQEIDILCSVRHKRIVQIHDVFEESRRFILVLELVGGGELFEKLSEEEVISEKEAVFFIRQILHGVKSMHKNNIMHLDLKPENVMLVDSNSTEIKIIDFGLAKKFKENEEIRVVSGTPAFAAPEVINFEKITKATDMWSIGVIAYVLLSGLSPFLGETAHETCSNVTSCQWDFDHPSFDRVSDEAKDFISKLVLKNPRNRMTVEQSIEHPWIKNSTRRKKSEIKTRNLLKFTRSFSQTIDFHEELRPPLERSPKVEDSGKRSYSNLQNIRETGEESHNLEKQNSEEMMGTVDGIDKRANGNTERLMLEEQLKSMEREAEEMKRRLLNQTDLQNNIEQLKCELERSLEAHGRLQETMLIYEEEKSKLREKNSLQRKELSRIESKNEELRNSLEERTQNYDSLSRKCKRLQEKLEGMEELEEKISELERDKARKIQKINELEENVEEIGKMKNRNSNETDKIRQKLEKDNKELQDVVESCNQEIEEMDERLSTLENENSKLRRELKQLRDENNFDQEIETLKDKIEHLESLNTELESKLAAEVKNKKLIEMERDSIEEEFEEERNNLESRIQKITDRNKQLEEESKELHSLLDASKKSYYKLDEDYRMLKNERKKDDDMIDEYRKTNDIINDLKKENDVLKKDYDRLNTKLLALMEERQKLEEEAQTKENGVTDRRQSGSSKEFERVKSDLKMTQEYLRIATDTNTELQLQVQKLKKDHETELSIQLIEQEARLNNVNQEQIERVKEEMMDLNASERKELEDRITVQDFAIRKLQALLELREQEDSTAEENSDIVPISMNGEVSGNADHGKIFNSVNVTISAGKSPRNSHKEEDDEDENPEDTLTERELRRISYKLADGLWSDLGQALCLRGREYENVMSSNLNDQEKIYRLLALWKSEMRQPRKNLISQLTVAVERIRRKDVVRFVKEMNAREPAGFSIRKRIRNFVK